MGSLRRLFVHPEHAVDAGTADAKAMCDGCGPELLLIAQAPQGGRVDARFAALVDAFCLCGLDAFELAFAAQVGLELGVFSAVRRLPRNNRSIGLGLPLGTWMMEHGLKSSAGA